MVICYNRGEERARTLLAGLPAIGHRVARLAVEDPRSVRELGEEVGRSFGRVDILVNSAGITPARAARRSRRAR